MCLSKFDLVYFGKIEPIVYFKVGYNERSFVWLSLSSALFVSLGNLHSIPSAAASLPQSVWVQPYSCVRFRPAIDFFIRVFGGNQY